MAVVAEMKQQEEEEMMDLSPNTGNDHEWILDVAELVIVPAPSSSPRTTVNFLTSF